MPARRGDAALRPGKKTDDSHAACYSGAVFFEEGYSFAVINKS